MALTTIQNFDVNTSGTYTFANVNVSSNVTAGNITLVTGGNANLGNLVTANYFTGNGSLLTGITVTNGNSNIVVSANSVVTISTTGVSGVVTISNSGSYINSNVIFNGVSNIGPVANIKITGGSNSYMLTTDGTGNLSWSPQPGGASAGPSTITSNNLGSITGAVTIDTGLSAYYTATSTGAITWTFSNAIASPNATNFILKLINGGSYTQIWPASAKWPGGIPPTLTATGVDTLSFITDDGGTTWRGVALMLDSR